MIRSLLVSTAVFSALALMHAAPSSAREIEKARLLNCASAQNCSVIPGVCPGEFQAVNIRFEIAQTENINKERMKSSCSGKKAPGKFPGAACIDNQCTLTGRR